MCLFPSPDGPAPCPLPCGLTNGLPVLLQAAAAIDAATGAAGYDSDDAGEAEWTVVFASCTCSWGCRRMALAAACQ